MQSSLLRALDMAAGRNSGGFDPALMSSYLKDIDKIVRIAKATGLNDALDKVNSMPDIAAACRMGNKTLS